MRQRRNRAAIAALVSLGLAACAPSGRSHPLSSYVVTKADPYTAWPEDPLGCGGTDLSCSKEALAEMKTGPLDIHGASYMDCNGVGSDTLRRDHWVASVLRNWVDWTAKPEGLITLCVSQFDTPTDALTNYRQVKGSHAPTGTVVAPLDIKGIAPIQAYCWSIPDSPLQIDSVIVERGIFVITIGASVLTHAVGPLQVGRGAEAIPIITRLRMSKKC